MKIKLLNTSRKDTIQHKYDYYFVVSILPCSLLKELIPHSLSLHYSMPFRFKLRIIKWSVSFSPKKNKVSAKYERGQ